MKVKYFRIFPLWTGAVRLAMLLSLPVLSASWWNPEPLQQSFMIDPASKLAIHGSSNVNRFSCLCKDQFGNNTARFETQDNGQSAQFSRTTLKLTTAKLDCGNKGINRDMYETLKSEEYPTIDIQLLQVTQPAGHHIRKCDEWVPMQAQTAITLANVTQKMAMAVKGLRMENGKYRFAGSRVVRMTDFGIQPPTVLFGMIKVNDEITIDIDLVIELE